MAYLISVDLPDCVIQCVNTTLTSRYCDIETASTCLCLSETLQESLWKCVLRACNTTDIVDALTANQSLCAGTPSNSKDREARIAMITLFVITCPIVTLRFFARWRTDKGLGWDDYMMMITATIFSSAGILVFLGINAGLGQHAWNLALEQVTRSNKFWLGLELLYTLTQVGVKISTFLFYLRIFPQRYMVILCKTGISWVATHGVIFLFVIGFRCKPIAACWDLTIDSPHCLGEGATVVSGAGLSIAEDLFILLLPVVELYRLNMGLQKKLFVGVLFSVGFLACITSMVRLEYALRIEHRIIDPHKYADILIWSSIELAMAVICACLPFLRPLIVDCLSFISNSAWDGSNIFSDGSRWSETLRKAVNRSNKTDKSDQNSGAMEAKEPEASDLESGLGVKGNDVECPVVIKSGYSAT